MEGFPEGTEIVRVYLAGSLAEAQQVEAVLGGAGVDFAVEAEEFPSRNILLLPSTRRLAGFWVREEAVADVAAALERAGCVAGLVKVD
jgi:hypothetical protein